MIVLVRISAWVSHGLLPSLSEVLMMIDGTEVHVNSYICLYDGRLKEEKNRGHGLMGYLRRCFFFKYYWIVTERALGTRQKK